MGYIAAVDWSALAQNAFVPLILGSLGFWSGWRTRSDRQQRAARTQEAQMAGNVDNRALREMDIVRQEWGETKIWWTAELKEARAAEARCEQKFHQLQRWAVRMAGKWNAHHPDDPCELPNGEH